MKRLIHHPLWTHLPELLLVGVVIAAIAWVWPLPQRVPVHFGATGEATRWGSPWVVVVALLGTAFLILAGSVLVAELWARQETRKRFNWVVLILQLHLAGFAALSIDFFQAASTQSDVLEIAWPRMLALIGGTAAIAILLESMRPISRMRAPMQPLSTAVDPETAKLAERLRSERKWVYWETQESRWYQLIIGACVCVTAGIAIVGALWLPLGIVLVLVITALVLALGWGGMRVLVGPNHLTVCMGMLPVPLLRLSIADVEAVQVEHFSPLVDFGGWGIRWSAGTWAFFLKGDRGVRLRTRSGREFVIGSDHPEHLQRAILAAKPLSE